MIGRNKTIIILTFVIAIIGAFLVIGVTAQMLLRYAENEQIKEFENEYAITLSSLEEIEDKKTSLINTFDEENLTTIKLIKTFINNEQDFPYSNEKMDEILEMLGVDIGLAVIDTEGNIICSSNRIFESFTAKRFNQIRLSFTDEGVSQPFTINYSTREDVYGGLRYYSTMIDENRILVLSTDEINLYDYLWEDADARTIFENVHVGLDGFLMSVNRKDNTFEYCVINDNVYSHSSALKYGIEESDLYDNNVTFMKIDGKQYFCMVKELDSRVLIYAVPRSEIVSNRYSTVSVVLILYLIFALIMILYVVFYAKQKNTPDTISEARRFVRGRIIAIFVAGLIGTFVGTFFMQQLFVLSRQSASNKTILEELKIEYRYEKYVEERTKNHYTERYMSLAHIAAGIISSTDSDDLDIEFMRTLKDVLGVNEITYIGKNGNTIASSNDYWGFSLSKDEKSPYNKYWDILNGEAEEISNEAILNINNYTISQTLACAVVDENYKQKGLLLLEASPDILIDFYLSPTTERVLTRITNGNNRTLFAIDEATKDLIYLGSLNDLYSNNALDHGIKENQIIAGENDFITLGNNRYYAVSDYCDGNYIYVATETKVITRVAFFVAVLAAICNFVMLLILFLLLPFGIRKMEVSAADEEKDNEMINVEKGNGEDIVTRSILNRFYGKGVPWSDKTAGQKITFIAKGIIIILAAIILVIMVLSEKIFSDDAIINFIMKGSWHKAVNIFAITKALIIAIIIAVAFYVVKQILLWFAGKMGAKGETICRLLCSLLSLVSAVSIVFISLGLFGVDTTVLLTSAGILSLVVGLGANSLIKDFLAGLSIVFEGSFQVGDIVKIGDFRGTVIEIGIRTTKVKETAGNVSVISNSSLDKVLNLTKDLSTIVLQMRVKKSEDIVMIEGIITEGLESIKEKLPDIIDGPSYKGIVSLKLGIDIMIIARCVESKRDQLERDLRREVFLLLKDNNLV